MKEQNILSEQLQGALNSRVLVEQAKGMFAERHGVEVAQAFVTVCAPAQHAPTAGGGRKSGHRRHVRGLNGQAHPMSL